MISKLKLISLTVKEENFEILLNNFVTFSGFHPVDPNTIISSVHGTRSFESNNPCDPLLDEIKEIENKIGLKFESKKISCFISSLDEIHQYIEDEHKKVSDRYNEIKVVEDEIKTYEQALFQVQKVEDMNIAFEDFFNAKFVSIRFGKLPSDVVERLRFYEQKPFIFVPFTEEDGYVWCLYLTTQEYEREIDNIFSSMFFERVYIPEFVHGAPQTARVTLSNKIDEDKAKLESLNNELIEYVKSNENDFDKVKGELEFLSDIYKAKQYAVGLGERVSLTGYIDKSSVKKLEEHFAGVPSIEIQVQDADADKRFQPPTKLKNNWFTRPFQFFVEMYGVPSYHDIDPTLMVSITYSLLFGIMFGDFGQGLAVALIGFILSKLTKNSLAPILTRIGFSSAFFGIVYGETFGNETFLDPFYEWLSKLFNTEIHPLHPMDNTVTMNLLLATVAIGAAIILSSIIINTVTKFRVKKYADALFSSNGLSGLLLYGFVLIGIVLQMLLGIKNVFNPVTIILFIVIPIILIFFKEPIERKLAHQAMFPEGVGGFITEGFFELFEVLLSYVTNTLSFLRVGGFVLSHAGMMLVVATLMNMASGAGSIVVSVLGNLFVMGLEGLIVGIQVLRLEFYEMFSRYFEGDGILFNPIF